eukprot:CAMPEP_0198206060 /NCGR_PEP_ID=MMETSP1445-20131203/9583_1 /TAXON_ID=36898 /ORGANISM="Pyramimonas sp., Strain CCMP2087" /LENGTH=471 /DNA_ID=CAMNT_0043878595 /DNA_START=717 /DNA_END=2132 /DNA_ORIENTATION=-
MVGIVVYGLLALLVLALDLMCTLKDPSDTNLLHKLKFIKSGKEWDDALHSQVMGNEVCFCVICRVSVDPRSKHCKACDKCIMGFDHHCKWLNNCVGSRNYKVFFLLLTFTFILVIAQFGVVLTEFVLCFTDKTGTRKRVEEVFHGDLNLDTFVALAAVYMCLLFITCGLLGELYLFHMVLWRKQMTTYDYILAERKRKEEASKLQSEDLEGLHLQAAQIDRAPEKSNCCGKVCCFLLIKSGKIVAEESESQIKSKSRRQSRPVTINPCRLLKTDKIGDPASFRKNKEAPRGKDIATVDTEKEMADKSHGSGKQRAHLEANVSKPRGGPAAESYNKNHGGSTNFRPASHMKPPVAPSASDQYTTGEPYGSGQHHHQRKGSVERDVSTSSMMSHKSHASAQSPSAVRLRENLDSHGKDKENDTDTESEDGAKFGGQGIPGARPDHHNVLPAKFAAPTPERKRGLPPLGSLAVR